MILCFPDSVFTQVNDSLPAKTNSTLSELEHREKTLLKREKLLLKQIEEGMLTDAGVDEASKDLRQGDFLEGVKGQLAQLSNELADLRQIFGEQKSDLIELRATVGEIARDLKVEKAVRGDLVKQVNRMAKLQQKGVGGCQPGVSEIPFDFPVSSYNDQNLTGKTTNQMAFVRSRKVSLVLSPQRSDEVLAVVERGAPVQVQSLREGWYRVRTSNGQLGWISGEDLVFAGSGSSAPNQYLRVGAIVD